MSSLSFVPLSIPDITAEDQAHVQACMASGWVSSAGPWVEQFEADVATYLNSPYAVAVSSGTAALHLSLLLIGVRPGDLVIMPDLTFVAPANAVAYCGATPVFIDVDADSWQMSPHLLSRFLTEECTVEKGRCIHIHSQKRVAALLLVHTLGYAADLDRLLPIADQHHLPVVEDAAEALGSQWQGQALGTFGTLGCLSFNGNKLLTTGGGGMILTANETLAAQARHLSTQARTDAFTYQHDAVGYNYRLSSLAAALGISQLKRIRETLARKRTIAECYQSALPSLTWPIPLSHSQPNHWLMTAVVGDRDKIAQHLTSRQIGTRALWTPMHRLPMFQQSLWVTEHSISDHLFKHALSLPSSVGLSREDQHRVIDAVQEAISPL